MPWPWSRGAPAGPPPEDPAAARARLQAERDRQERDQYLLESGRLPSTAEERLRAVGQGQALAFTSDLAPDEAGLLRGEGLQPICLVGGSAFYHVGYAYASAWQDVEVTQLSQAYNEATRLAVTRMAMEAQAVGAHGVVGVRYRLVRHEWADGTVEVQLVGSAVRGPEPAPRQPWLCDLSGQEWWALRRGGYEPASLAYGHCTWFILTQMQDEWTEQSVNNAELRHFSEALTHCRNRASHHLLRCASEAGATGLVGIHIVRRLDEVRLTGPDENPAYEREHHNLVLSMIGTAIRRRAGAPAGGGAAPALVLSLRDGRLVPQESLAETEIE
jgi:uncharacterized protein YbjQ (UPF0145 family)